MLPCQNKKILNTKTAILIFANSADKETERKSFLSADVFAELNNQTLKKVQKSGIEYFYFTEKQQIGSSFGERFSNAIESVFNNDFENIITIDNDTPHLKPHHLIHTSQQLEKNDLVVGPSKNGGFYLMGIKKEHFQKETFLKLPWQTNRLQKYISSIAYKNYLEINFLEPLNDLDTKEDLKTILNCFKKISLSILKLPQKLFFRIEITFLEAYHLISETSYSQNLNKGSPII